MFRPFTLALVLASTALTASQADAAVLSFATALTSATGVFAIGDTVSFTGTYDEAQAPEASVPGLTSFTSFTSSTLTIAGQTFTNPWYYAFYDPASSRIEFGSVASSSFQPRITVDLARTDATDLSMPGTAELTGKSGSIAFDSYGPPFLAGSGFAAFAIGATSAVPEPASWALMIGGIALAGGMMRRQAMRTRVRFG